MTEFQEKLRQQHEDSMHRELQALLATANKAEAEVSAVRTPPPMTSSRYSFWQPPFLILQPVYGSFDAKWIIY